MAGNDRPTGRLIGVLIGIDGRICLVPADGSPDQPQSLLTTDEIRDIFARSPGQQRLLLLDCCQIAAPGAIGGSVESASKERRASTAQEEPLLDSEPERPTRCLRRRSAAALDPACVEALRAGAGEWTVLTACSPNEHSWETPARSAEDDLAEDDLAEDHGLFTHLYRIPRLSAHHVDTRLTTPIPTVPVQPRFATLLFALPAILLLLWQTQAYAAAYAHIKHLVSRPV